MKYKILVLAIIITTALGAFETLLKLPESVVYIEEMNAFLSSNKSGGAIIKSDMEGKETVFNQDLISVRGITRLDSLLYCAADGGVFGISLNSGKLEVQIPIPDTGFLNDIAWDGKDYLYVSDMKKDNIIRIDLRSRYNMIFAGTIESPNGLYYDREKEELIVVCNIKKSPIVSVNAGTGVVKTLTKTKLSYLDGITRDKNGYFYVSSWGDGTVYTFDSEFKEKPQKFITHQDGPADIYYFEKENAIAIPNFRKNIIKFATVRDSYQF